MVTSRHQPSPSAGGSDRLQFGEDVGEEPRIGVDPEHGPAEAADHVHAPVPEPLPAAPDQERLQRVRYLPRQGAKSRDRAVVFACWQAGAT